MLARLQKDLLPQDVISVHSPRVIEVLLTELHPTAARAGEIARALCRPGVDCGGTSIPGSASDAHELFEQAKRALERARATHAPEWAEEDAQAPPTASGGIVTESETMRRLFETVRQVANSAIPVLIQGETGSGKEVIARAIHEASGRASARLLSVNCGALPANLIEAMLFGHERGAFTGADRLKRGLFEEAAGGTLFLDEVGELPAAAQTSLLRVLENKVVTRVGGVQELPVNVRIVAATHRRLDAMCERGTFREDLLFRLNVMTLSVPPLRDHPEDIPALAQLFLERAAEESGRRVHSLSEAALDLLSDYGWPGNVRELRNEVERAVVVCHGARIEPGDLSDRVRESLGTASSRSSPERQSARPEVLEPAQPSPSSPGANPPQQAPPSAERSLRHRLREFERKLITEALAECGGNQTLTAERLELPRRTLVHKLRLLDIKGG